MSLTEGNNETQVGEVFSGSKFSVLRATVLPMCEILCMFGKARVDLDSILKNEIPQCCDFRCNGFKRECVGCRDTARSTIYPIISFRPV